ncbi:MAG: hypothetical protein J3R72DRAFT_462078 [Linnemannia gamsii]|nr:MAG: hypothetical protein J3R72DRAFT_462078 [Linnemannia gamsii]
MLQVPFHSQEGYNPVLLYHSILASITTTGQRRLDVLGTSFRTIRHAYSSHPQDVANKMLQKEKDLASAFYWSLSSRQHFAEYMRDLGWTTEADVAIAQDAQPGDVVISSDSDMMAYASVETLWRPVSQNLVLAYHIPDILKSIKFSRNQLTALAIRNVYSLGPATNYSIIKAIGHKPDVQDIVSAYLRDGKVVTRNTEQETFETSMRLFIDELQTRIELVVVQMPSQVAFDACQQHFEDLMQKYNQWKQTRGAKSR